MGIDSSSPSSGNLFFEFLKTFWRDMMCLYLYVKFQIQFRWITYWKKTVIRQFDQVAHSLPHKTAIIYQGERTCFIDLLKQSYQIANWLESSLDLGLDDTKLPNESDSMKVEHSQIGLMLSNSPELIAFILGVARVRASSVLFNTNHRLDSLINSFNVTKCRVLIFDAKYLDAIIEVADQLPDYVQYFMYDRTKTEMDLNNNEETININNYQQYKGMTKTDLLKKEKKWENFAPILKQYPIEAPLKTYSYEMSDKLTYIFTSGTTGGAAKATPTDNVRFIVGYLSQMNAFGIRMDDNIYISLPLYHSFSLIIGVGQCLLGGTCVTLADRFSASRFWSDCQKYHCTSALYIGEICRYLLAQPISHAEKTHSLRMIHGLGLKKEIWKEFCTRFNIPRVCEFYGSSEGNINLFNINNVQGSCGLIPYYIPFIQYLYPIFLIKVDTVTMEPIRNENGLCQLAGPGDFGLIVGAIKPHLSYTKFLGYTSSKETSKKILRDIVKPGDCAFISGDLMMLDKFGNLYFKDRTGDTFRWKGENVSTTEVESIASQCLDHQLCTVYGVEIPDTDGRAGMIAIQSANPETDQTDLGAFYAYMKERVPEYAVPKLIRFTNQIETTSTHKLMKYQLRNEGFDLERIDSNDRLFYFDRQNVSYQPLTMDAYQRIMNGEIRF